MSEITSVSIRTIQRIEKEGMCSKETLLALATAFDVDIQEFTLLKNKNQSIGKNPGIKLFGFNFPSYLLSLGKSALIGLLVMFPAIYFITANLLYDGFGISFLAEPLSIFYKDKKMFELFNLFSRIVFLGGLTIAALLNFIPMISFNIQKEDRSIKSYFSFKPVIINSLIMIA
ncbi:MAG: helix-turn-helix domain-containing protein, partial [Promethearchaeota archaeon]